MSLYDKDDPMALVYHRQSRVRAGLPPVERGDERYCEACVEPHPWCRCLGDSEMDASSARG